MRRILKRQFDLIDILGSLLVVIALAVSVLLITTFLIRIFVVDGSSMEKTLYTGDRVLVNRLPVTMTRLQNKPFIPSRGQIIAFQNPEAIVGSNDEYIVKRVIAFPGERVVVKDGKITVYNAGNPAGFNPDDANHGEPGQPTSGEVDQIVPENALFVSGDHRQGTFSLDSRNGLGFIPYYDIIGTVTAQIWPLDKIRTF